MGTLTVCDGEMFCCILNTGSIDMLCLCSLFLTYLRQLSVVREQHSSLHERTETEHKACLQQVYLCMCVYVCLVLVGGILHLFAAGLDKRMQAMVVGSDYATIESLVWVMYVYSSCLPIELSSTTHQFTTPKNHLNTMRITQMNVLDYF
jgi:hypothetical protein